MTEVLAVPAWHNPKPRAPLRAILVAILTFGILVQIIPADADSAWDREWERKLFQARMRLFGTVNASDDNGRMIRDMVINAELLGWRQQNPNASASQILKHVGEVEWHLEDKLKSEDWARPAYEVIVRICDTLTEIPVAGIAFAGLKNLHEWASGENVRRHGEKADQVVAAGQNLVWQNQLWTLKDKLWEAVHDTGARDKQFADAWNGQYGTRYNIRLDDTAAEHLKDPLLATWVNTDLILELIRQGDIGSAADAEEMKKQLAQLLKKVDEIRRTQIEEIAKNTAENPVGPGAPKTTQQQYQDAVDKAKETQLMLNAASAAVYLISTAAGFVDKRLARDIALVGGAAIAIAGALATYGPTIFAAGASGGPVTFAAVALVGAVVAAIMSLAPMFAQEQPSEIQVAVQQIRQDLMAMERTLQGRFDRIDSALTRIYADTMTQFNQLLAIAVHTQQEIEKVQLRLAVIEGKVDLYGSAVLRALGDAELKDFRSAVDKYINYEQTFGRPMTYSDYISAENEFHLTGTQLAEDDAFVFNTGYQNARPADVLDPRLYGPEGSIRYLGWLAKNRWHNDGTYVLTRLASPSVWHLASHAYSTLELQNPDSARRVNKARAADLIQKGEEITHATRAFSQPDPKGEQDGTYTNKLFNGLSADYEKGLVNFANAVSDIRMKLLDGKKYDISGSAEQSVPALEIADPGSGIKSCTSGRVLNRVPTHFKFAELPPAVLFAVYVQPGELQKCYNAEYTNEKVVTLPRSEQYSGNLRVTLRIQFRRRGVEWHDVATASRIVGSYKCGIYTGGGGGNVPTSCIPRIESMMGRWDSEYWQSFDNVTPDVDNAYVGQEIVPSTTKFLQGKQRDLYRLISEGLTGPSPVGLARDGLSETARLYQAYTQLGFPRALAGDHRLSAMLFGSRPLPADLDADHRYIEKIYQRASKAYEQCEPDFSGDRRCGYPGVPRNFDPLASQDFFEDSCRQGALPQSAARNDPVTDCLIASGLARLRELNEVYEVYFNKLARGVYVEGLPAMTSSVTAAELTHKLLFQPGTTVTTRPNTPSTTTPILERYAVRAQDTLSKLSLKFYGTGNHWELIYASNLTEIRDPNQLRTGMQLDIPRLIVHRVGRGETLGKISSERLGGAQNWQILYIANKSKIGPNPNVLREGLALAIPLAPRR